MGEVDPRYSDRYDHSTVARWESGATRPTRERLEVFGRALELTTTEIEGMIELAGLENSGEARLSLPDGVEGSSSNSDEDGARSRNGRADESLLPSLFAGSIASYFLSRFVLPGLGVVIVGYILSVMGWNASWMMLAYLITAIGLIVAQAFFRMRHSNQLKDLYFISVFFILCTTLLKVPILRMDPFGLYAFDSLAGTPIPYLIALVTNLFLALIAGLMFDFLSRWQNNGQWRTRCVFLRASIVSYSPLVLLYVFTLLFCSVGPWIYFLTMFSFLGVMFMAFLVLQDEDVKFSQWQGRLFLQASVAFTLICILLGGAGILTLYWQPSLMVLPDHTLLRSWEIDFAQLGYSADELIERYRIGAVWSSIAGLVFMVTVLGGKLIVSAFRLESGDPPYESRSTEVETSTPETD